jgi:AraC-like DNA-binding protein
MNNVDSIARKSDYLVEKTGLSYPYLSRIFSNHEHITLEKYIILNKIERIKELIDQEELTLSEIAFNMDYSSVQYLSNQFKQMTGMTVSDYKESDRSSKIPIDQLYQGSISIPAYNLN